MAEHLARRAVGDALAEIEHGDVVGDRLDQLHVVLDDQDGQAVAFQAAQQLAQFLLLGRVQPGGRLVEQQQVGRPGQRAGDLDVALMAVGERADRQPGLAAQADEIERRQRALPPPRRRSRTSLPGRSAPIITFSSTVRPRNTRMFW